MLGIGLLVVTHAAHAAPCLQDGAWTPWAPGFDVGQFVPASKPVVGDGRIVIARIDPARWALGLHTGPGKQTAAALATAAPGVVAVTNAGMFATDHRTHVGSLVVGGRDIGRPTAAYKSIAEWDPAAAGLPPFRIRDTDSDAPEGAYQVRMQNLRLIKRPGRNRWSRQEKRWSEAALGEDAAGNVLLVFTRSAWSMHDLNDALVSLGVVAAQHLEGGPEAQLWLKAGACSFSGFGSYETGFNDNDGNARAWPVPNLMTVKARPVTP